MPFANFLLHTNCVVILHFRIFSSTQQRRMVQVACVRATVHMHIEILNWTHGKHEKLILLYWINTLNSIFRIFERYQFTFHFQPPRHVDRIPTKQYEGKYLHRKVSLHKRGNERFWLFSRCFTFQTNVATGQLLWMISGQIDTKMAIKQPFSYWITRRYEQSPLDAAWNWLN